MDTTETQGGHHKRKSSTNAVTQPHGSKRARTQDDNEEEDEEDLSTILAQMAETLARLSEKQRKRKARQSVGAQTGGHQQQGPQAQPLGARAAELSSTMANNNLNVTESASSTSAKSGRPPQTAPLQPTKEQPTIEIDRDAAELCLNPQWVKQKVQQAKLLISNEEVQPFYDKAISCLTRDNGDPLYKEALVSLQDVVESTKTRLERQQTQTSLMYTEERVFTKRGRVQREHAVSIRELGVKIRDLDGILQATKNALEYLEEAEKS